MAPSSPPPGSRSTDRRVRRTRRALQHALVGLVLEYGFEDLTVERIADRADVARATFYLHFVDKTDLLTSIADDLIGDLTDHMGMQRLSSHGAVVRAAFAHVAANRETYRVLLSGAGDGRPLDRTFDLATEFGERMIARLSTERGISTRLPVDAVARIWSGQLIATMRWWSSGATPYTAEEISDILVQTRFYGLAWVYGLAPGDQSLAATELDKPSD